MHRSIPLLALLLATLACADPDAEARPVPRQTPARPHDQDVAQRILVPDGSTVQPGGAVSAARSALTHPYEGDARAAEEGKRLFVAYNCIDCHGADGAGGMGPSFQDGRWHFGGTPAAVFQSIYEGRPDGMPTWGGRIADDQIWKLTAYVRSLAVSHDGSTETFTGRTVERGGH